MILGNASTPPGLRIYAIGDVHGCNGLLGAVHAKIVDDMRARPVGDYRIVHVGDYVDRGPDSRGVVERLMKLSADNPKIVCLKGNHEAMMLEFLDDPRAKGFLNNGGLDTTRSYGVKLPFPSSLDPTAVRAEFVRVIPREHLDFIQRLKLSVRFGDYFFCHAGVRPQVALNRQTENDLLWIRYDFLDDTREHEAVIVHGHTPKEEPEVRPNRIDIDTGAFATGRLTCLVLEGTSHRFL
ncbi:MAG: serine/threonine protein phosphatase [Bauldia sp.]|nr:serine/threonine protein phosphatase [Bauldia sp.]